MLQDECTMLGKRAAAKLDLGGTTLPISDGVVKYQLIGGKQARYRWKMISL
jgi:hypothetical protein